MFYLDSMVIQIAQDVGRLLVGMDANNLMSRRFTGRGNNLDAAAEIVIALDQIEQPLALQDGKCMACIGVWVLQLWLELIPIRTPDMVTGIWKAGRIVAVILAGRCRVMGGT